MVEKDGTLRGGWMRSIDLISDEKVLRESSCTHDHQWLRHVGKAYLTNKRLLFQSWFFPFTFNPMGHEHRWLLTEISTVGISRHAGMLFLYKTLFVEVQKETYWFLVREPQHWVNEIQALRIPKG